MPLVIVPFALFAIAILLRFWLLYRVRRRLATSYPSIWLDISTKRMFVEEATLDFIRRHDEIELGDSELSSTASWLRAVDIAAPLAVLLVLAGLVTGYGWITIHIT